MLAAAWYDLLRKYIIQSLRQKKKKLFVVHAIWNIYSASLNAEHACGKTCAQHLIYLYTITQLNRDASNFHITITVNAVFRWAPVTVGSFLLPLCHIG